MKKIFRKYDIPMTKSEKLYENIINILFYKPAM